MDAIELITKLVVGAMQRGGQRLEFVAGRPAVLATPKGRLVAEGAVLSMDSMRSLLQATMPEERWVALELGDEVGFEADLGGVRRQIRARRNGETLELEIDLAPAASPAARGDRADASPADEPPQAAPSRDGRPDDRPLDRMLRRLVEAGASDLHLSAGSPPMCRLHGDVAPLPGWESALSSEHVLLMCEEIAPTGNRAEFRAENDTDFAYEIAGLARFRANLFRDRHGVGAVFRQIPATIRSLDDLGLPACVRTLCTLQKGLVLVTGPTGSGKSTTLAAMIDHINETRSDHIITIEDPIEFIHANKRCLVNQREVHTHTESFKRALRAALREDPDIVLVGELRDLETMAIAIETAETGHLVFGTLHTTTAVSTVDRLIDQFPPDRQEQIRVMLSESLKGVVAQILVKRLGGGRVAAHEILLGIPAVANLIREGKTFQIPSIMQTNKRIGMQLMNDALADLVRRGLVDVDEALARSADRDGLRASLKLGPAPPAGST